MVLHSERWTLTDDFHQPQHSDPPPRLVCLGTPLATCALPTGVFYLLTYLLTQNPHSHLKAIAYQAIHMYPLSIKKDYPRGAPMSHVHVGCRLMSASRRRVPGEKTYHATLPPDDRSAGRL